MTGLLADKLAGANLSNAKLPEDIAKFEALDHVAEISKHARNNFLAVLGACVFSWLTIATTTDAALLANRSETALPIIGAKIPIAGFYWAAQGARGQLSDCHPVAARARTAVRPIAIRQATANK